MNRQSLNLSYFILCIISISLCLDRGYAQQRTQDDKPGPLDARMEIQIKAASLQKAAFVVSSLAHVTILADGESKIGNVDVQAQGTVREVLDTVADKFDYKWRVTQGGIILMTKRFAGAVERPQIHIAEMQQMARDISNALTLGPKIDYQVPINTKLEHMLRSLSAEQYNAIAGLQPVYMKSLPESQFQVVKECMWQIHFAQKAEKWARLNSLLNNLPTSYFVADPTLTRSTFVTENGQEVKKTYIDVLHIVRDDQGHLTTIRLGEPFIAVSEEHQR